MIRAARFGDIPRLTELLHEGGRRSIYAGRAHFDERECKRILMQAIQRHGAKSEGGTFCIVHDRDGVIDGMMFLALQRVYLIAVELRAIELFYYVTPLAGGRAGPAMLRKAERWCAAVPGCIEMTITPNTVAGAPERVGRLLERRGFAHFGAMYRKEIAA